ncbi:SH3 domain-containing protein [Mycena chlorophos]|uniref:SH3 domain-containing protein n=1 Tax=Mycena chlorophos TaxID=658473 RepID=A0A8H6SB21_MYCCL|nr:SH3 domain-containing protein [Mycena chlorophos]
MTATTTTQDAAAAQEKRQDTLAVVTDSAVVFTGEGFTFTLDGAATLTETVAAGQPTPVSGGTATVNVDSSATSSPPTVATSPAGVVTNTGAAIVGATSGFTTIAPTPVASVITNPLSSNSNSDSKQSGGGTSANDGAQPLGAASTSSKSGGLSTGAIVGITLVLVLVIVGGILFFIRYRAVQKRKARRATGQGVGGWAGAAGFAQPAPVPAGSFASGATMADVERSGAMSEQSAGVSFARAQAAAIASSSAIPPPPNAYGAPFAAMPAGSATALVRYEFIPSLPDELSIVTGETVRIVAEYDDGWALCANARNEQGMVPLECLERTNSASAPRVVGARNSRRGSSLGTAR